MDQDVGTLIDLEVPPSWGMRDGNMELVWTRNKGLWDGEDHIP